MTTNNLFHTLQNPTVGELNLEGLDDQEKLKILEVVKKEQSLINEQADMMNRQKMEGQLNKFTNLMKGWQYRWFVLDPESGTLTYYLDKSKQKYRGSLPLSGAVISPSDEDSMSFMISAHNGDIYRLRAVDAKERQHWINLIRAVAEYHGQNALKPIRPPQPSDNALKRSATVSTTSHNSPNTIGLHKTYSMKLPSSLIIGSTPRQTHTQTALTNPIQEELKNIKDALNSVVEYQSSVVDVLNNPTSDVFSTLEEKVLLLKATSQATVNILQQCYSIIQQQSLEVQGLAQTRSLPPGAKIEWFEPHRSRLEKAGLTGSEESIEITMEPDVSDFVTSKYSESEIEDTETYKDEQLEDMEPHKSVILHLLSQLKLGMDLTRVVLPTFVLEKRSLLEMYADFFGHPELFTKISDQKSAEDRMLAVLEFYLTSFHVGRKAGVAKKPYNPILGEYFVCSLDVEQKDIQNDHSLENKDQTSSLCNGRVHFIAEQVSHHPPISAFYAECPSKKISMNTHIWTKSKFYGMSIGVINVGEGIINLPELNEEYIISFPNAYCRSILTTPWIELGGRTVIRCPQSGYTSTITFHTKPFYGGKLNRVTCEVKNSCGEIGEIFCRGEGAWDGSIELTFTDRTPSKKILDVNSLKLTPKRVRPIALQSDAESRRLWQNVTDALVKSDLEKATDEKHRLEEQQRNDAKQRLTADLEWKTKFFKKNGEGWIFNSNMAHVQRKKKNRATSTA